MQPAILGVTRRAGSFSSAFAENLVLRLHFGVIQERNVMSATNISFDSNEFTGKRILVTGGSKGIGEAIVNRLRRGGATVLAAARNIPAGAKPEQFIEADVSTRAGADHIIKTTFDRLGGLDILINSVGGSSAPGGGVLALTDEHTQRSVRRKRIHR